MKLKFLIDESVGTKPSEFLNRAGYDSISISEKFSGAEDKFVLSKARKEKRIIITNDKDFGELIFYQKLNTYGIILLRLSNESAENKIEVIENFLSKYSSKIWGNFIVITDDKIRIRKI